MLNLPKSTELKKRIYKQTIFKKFNLDKNAQTNFDNDVSTINIVGQISPSTMNLDKGKTVSCIYVVSVLLKHKDFNKNNIILISKLVNQNMILVLECDEESKLAIYHNKLIQNEWHASENCSIEVKGLNLDTVWENIIAQVGSIVVEQNNTLDEQIALDEQKAKLEKEIARLEKQARKEKQPRKKFELVQQINKLRKELIVI